MSEELTAAVQTPESLSTTVEEQGCEPGIIENFQALAAAGRILRQDSITDYAAAVVVQQIEGLQSIANDVDRQYAINVRGRKIKFKDRVAYLAVRERVASRSVDFATKVCRILSTDTTTDPPESESPVNSWNPDEVQGPECSKPAQ